MLFPFLVVTKTFPDWALQPGVTVPISPINYVTGSNHYNIPSAREAMWRALTMTKLLPNGTLETILPGGNNFGAAAHEAERKAYWATTFRAIGDVVHLVQDLAQPQHTRVAARANGWNTASLFAFEEINVRKMQGEIPC